MELASMNEYGCAVWLYGSRARGDEDILSDVDVFVVSDTEVSKKEVAQLVPGCLVIFPSASTLGVK